MKAARFALSLAGIVGSGCLVGCELVAGIQSLSVSDAGSESSTGDEGSAGPDSGHDAADGTVEMADGETNGNDAGEGGTSTGDGGPPMMDGSKGDSMSTAGFCVSRSPTPTFCDDFDEPGSLGAFSGQTMMNGSLALNNAEAVSPPSSLLAQDNALQSGMLDTALRNFFPSLQSPPSLFTFDFEIEPVVVDQSVGAALVAASLDFADAANNRYSVQFTLYQQNAAGQINVRLEEQGEFSDGGSLYQPHTLQGIPVGSWTELTLKLNRSSSPTMTTATVDFGGAQVLNDAPLSMDINPTSVTLTIGSAYESTPSGGWTTRYDNVVLDIGP